MKILALVLESLGAAFGMVAGFYFIKGPLIIAITLAILSFLLYIGKYLIIQKETNNKIMI